jgi:hypothetical protein
LNQHRKVRQRSVTDSALQLTAYSAPAFHRLPELEKRFFGSSVLEGSRWFRVSSMPDLRVTDNDKHFISYNQAGAAATFHSDPRPLDGVLTWDEVAHARTNRVLDSRYFVELLTILREEARLPPIQQLELFQVGLELDIDRLAAVVEEIASLLRRTPRVEWLILPDFASLASVHATRSLRQVDSGLNLPK